MSILSSPDPDHSAGAARSNPGRPSQTRWLLVQKAAGDDNAHDLVGAFEDLVHAHVAQIALDREVLQVAVTAVQLQRVVDDP